jgi:glycine/D-amino acid oxidase-like deaminating enzyme
MTVPSRADVVIIGGGIVGVTAALTLAQHGIPTVLCEKGRIAGEQSSRNWGWCRATNRDPREMPLMLESLRLWRRLDAEHGIDTGFRTTGIAFLCEDEAAVERQSAWLDSVAEFQPGSRMLGAAETAALFPGSATRWAGAIHTPGDGGAEPALATPAIAEAARRAGATILAGCAVRGLDIAAGRVAGVVTEQGRIAAGSVIVAAGAWSRLFLGNHGIDLPQLKVVGSVSRTAPVAGGPEILAASSRFGFRRRRDGGYTVARAGATISDIVPDSFRLLGAFWPAYRANWRNLRLRVGGRLVEEWRMPRRWALDAPSPFEQVRVLDPIPSRRILDGAATALAQAFPIFRGVPIVERWGGMIDVTPDAVPMIAPVAALPGLHVATGFSGHGFGLGPGAGALVADMVRGATPAVDPTPFRLERFGRRAAA